MTTLENFCATSLARDVPDELRHMADFLVAKFKDPVAILAYGSCIRGVAASETLMDFYVLIEDIADLSSSRISQFACAAVPPNVYYAELNGNLRAKYAVLPLAQFARWMTRETVNPYFWARFSQPSALVYVRDEMARADVAAITATAIQTCYANAMGLTDSKDALVIWTAGYANTYRTELRSEKEGRAQQIVETYPGYYREAAGFMASQVPIKSNIYLQHIGGKFWSALRLIKAAFTFQGGADYIVWKIERHSGEKIVLTDWQRRHPVIAGFVLIGTLLRKGAVR